MDLRTSPHALEERAVTSTLANGLEVVIVPFGVAPVATVAVLYRVGSRDESAGATGSAHLLEHMLFKGTPANNPRNGRNYADMMLEVGASFNATTGYDRTLYYQTIPAEYVDFALELEADRMRDAFIADEDRRFEMTVVRNEFERVKSRPAGVLSIETVAAAFREHPYHHPPIGWQSDVESVSTDRLRETYRTFYRPDNATLFVVGEIDAASVMPVVERFFGAVERPREPIPEVHTSEPAQTGERRVTVKWRGETSLLRLVYRGPGALGQQFVLSREELAALAEREDATREIAALSMLDLIVAGGATSRLSRKLVDTHLCVGVGADTWIKRDPGLFTIGATLAAGASAGRVMEVIEAELADLAEHGPEEAELERAKRMYATRQAFRTESCSSIALAFADSAACGAWRMDGALARSVAALTPDDVREAVARYALEDSRTTGYLVPGEPRAFSLPLAPLANGEPALRVEAAPLPRPARGRRATFAERIVRGSLDERVRWIALDEPQSGVIEVRVRFDAGPNYCERSMLAAVGASMLPTGTARRGRIEIERTLDEGGASRDYSVDDRSALFDGRALRVTASTVREGFATLTQALAEEFSMPAFAPAEFERVKLAFVTQIRNARTNAGARAAQAMNALLYAPSDPNYGPSIDEALADVETMTIDDVRAWYERVLLGANVTFAVAGGFDGTDQLERHLRAAFGSAGLASAPAVPVTRRAAAFPPAETREDIAVEGQRNVEIRIGRATSLTREAPDWLAATLANAILGASSLSGRLGRRLRVEEGLTYGIGSSFLTHSSDATPWRVTLGTNPENVARAVASVRDVMTQFVEEGPASREIEAARNAIAGSTVLATSTSDGIARTLMRMETFDLGDDFVDTQRERLEAVSSEEIVAAVARYLSPHDLAIVTAGPRSH